MDYSILLAQAALNGLVIGAMYMLMAVGFTLVFGIMRVVNFAHGEFYMLGAFTAFFTYVYWEMPFVVCLAIAAVTVGILGMLIERTLIQPFRSDEMSGMIATLAISVIIQNGPCCCGDRRRARCPISSPARWRSAPSVSRGRGSW